ncbi:DUF6216 family protein [Xenorhabdus bovienii]|uniref:DUF6216 family protein n=1 Tax=Xenorhabdus bovienii TaxID=40576 RepID=UPI003DA22A05
MNVHFESVFSIVKNSIVLSVIFFVVACLYIRIKSKSGFSIFNRLWMFVIKHRERSENNLINKIIEIEEFNFFYNTNAVSINQKEKFESWIDKYELDFKIISKLGSNLDIERLKIKKVEKFHPVIIFLFLFSIFIWLLISLTIALKPAGLIKINDDGWFWFNKNEAIEYSLFAKRKNVWIVTPETCSQKDLILNKITTETINVICDSFYSEKSLRYIDGLIKEQRWLFGITTAFLFVFILCLIKNIQSLLATYDARKMILSKIKKYRKK